MDDALLVRGLERRRHLPRDRQRLGEREAIPEREPIGQRRPLDQFHDQDRAGGRVLDAIERGDVRVIERGQDARFAVEAGAALGVGGPIAGQHFEGDVATQAGIARAIHLAHPARAERCRDLEHADVAADTHRIREAGLQAQATPAPFAPVIFSPLTRCSPRASRLPF